MKIATYLVWLLLVALCWSSQALGRDIARLDLDDAASIGLKIETDSDLKAQGGASVRIRTPGPTVVCLGEVGNLELENVRLLYRAKVRSDLEGSAYLEMWCRVGGQSYFSRGTNSTVKARSDWKILETPFFLKKGQIAESVTLNIVINGRGAVWVDDAVLSAESLK